MTLNRLPDWPERLAAHLEAHRRQPFAWGAHDCVLFSAGAVRAVLGCDLLPARWASVREAAVLLRQAGGLCAAVDAVLPRLSGTQWAMRGDVALVRAAQGRRWLAVVDGPRWWAPGPQGLISGPMDDAALAWGVGHA